MSYPPLPTPHVTVQVDGYAPQRALPVAAMHKIHKALQLSRTQRHTFEVFLREALHYTLRPGRRSTDVNGDAEVRVHLYVDRLEVTIRSDRQGPGSPLTRPCGQKNLLFGLMDRVEVKTTTTGKEVRAVKFLYRRGQQAVEPAETKQSSRGPSGASATIKPTPFEPTTPFKPKSVRLSTN